MKSILFKLADSQSLRISYTIHMKLNFHIKVLQKIGLTQLELRSKMWLAICAVLRARRVVHVVVRVLPPVARVVRGVVVAVRVLPHALRHRLRLARLDQSSSGLGVLT